MEAAEYAEYVAHTDPQDHAWIRTPKQLLRHLTKDHGDQVNSGVTVFGLCDIHDAHHGRFVSYD